MKPSVLLFLRSILLFILVLSWQGCGSTQQRDATEQLLASDAVDSSVSEIDFRALSGETVYFDTTYLKNIKGVGFVNAEYITSSLRQQLVAARCLLRDKKDDADYIVEARIGTLGTDRHEVTYGMPANNFLSAASSLVPNSPALPTLPELAIAKRNEQLAAAKIGAFAYHRQSGEPVWQSGVAPTRSTAKDLWILGAGPIQRGEIYGGTQFAGTKLDFSLLAETDADTTPPLVDYHKPAYFNPKIEMANEAEKSRDTGPKKPAAIAQAKPTPAKPSPAKQAAPAPKKTKPEKVEADSSTPKKPSNPKPPPNLIDSSSQENRGLRLRFHFDQPTLTPPPKIVNENPQLFRLDPGE